MIGSAMEGLIDDIEREKSRAREHGWRADRAERKLAILSAVGDALVTELRSAKPVRETILAILHEWETVRGQ